MKKTENSNPDESFLGRDIENLIRYRAFCEIFPSENETLSDEIYDEDEIYDDREDEFRKTR